MSSQIDKKLMHKAHITSNNQMWNPQEKKTEKTNRILTADTDLVKNTLLSARCRVFVSTF